MVRLQLSNKKIFAVHEDLICSRSPYIRKALYGHRQKVEGECPTWTVHYEKLPSAKDVDATCMIAACKSGKLLRQQFDPVPISPVRCVERSGKISQISWTI
jgi:hypothetical protein